MPINSSREGKNPVHAKHNGIHYTPPESASFLADVTVKALSIHAGQSITVLDPGCGDGGLLFALAKAVPAESRKHLTLLRKAPLTGLLSRHFQEVMAGKT